MEVNIEKIPERENKATSLVAVAIYGAIALVILLLVLIRYYPGGYYWTIIFVLLVWYITGAFIMWSVWDNKSPVLSIVIGIVFLFLSILFINSTIEQRHSKMREFLNYVNKNKRN